MTKYGIQYPVTHGWATWTSKAPSIPTFFVFDKNLRLVKTIQGFPGDGALTATINGLK